MSAITISKLQDLKYEIVEMRDLVQKRIDEENEICYSDMSYLLGFRYGKVKAYNEILSILQADFRAELQEEL